MQYRPEIDGLRALAVIPVILFHAGFSWFSGGFVGVDVFFVISGYLITTILMNDIEAGRFSLAHFYERRARRILPALFCVIVVCVPFAWLWLLPGQMKDFSQSLIAVGLFVSNILFWKESGYFDAAAEEKPLLHTWSLAVEEQYYLIFPVFLVLVWRFGRVPTFWVIAFLAALSLLLSEWGARYAPDANFYLAPTRAWELFAGSLAAFTLRARGKRPHDFLAFLGLAAIIISIFLYDHSTPFPGLYALLPVGGTVLLVLFAHQGTYVARILSFKALVGLGLISYSAYLWHQPLFVFARVRMMDDPSPFLFLGLSALSLVLAALSWRFVEQPFRRKDGALSSRRAVFLVSALGLGALIAFGFIGHKTQGYAMRVDDQVTEIEKMTGVPKAYPMACRLGMASGTLSGGRNNNVNHPLQGCLKTNAQAAQPDVMLIGDSHMESLAPFVQDALSRHDIASYAVSYIGCVPFAGFERIDTDQYHRCNAYNRAMLSYARQVGVTTLVLIGRFPLYLEGVRFDNTEGGVEHGAPAYIDVSAHKDKAAPVSWRSEERKQRVEAGYVSALQALLDEGFRVVLVEPIPEAGWLVPQYLAKAMMYDRPASDSTSLQVYRDRNQRVFNAFDQIDHPHLYRVPSSRALCSDITGRCFIKDDGGVLYRDDDHLSDYGAMTLAPLLVAKVEEALQEAD